MVTTVAVAISLLLVAASVVIHYEFLRMTSALANGLMIQRRVRILFVLAGVLMAHLSEVSLYAVAYYACEHWGSMGKIDGQLEGGLIDYFYLSITTFTTLGIGDVHPRGALRTIAGVESLNGLVLIGWSASFTYLSMEQFWEEDVQPTARS